MALTSAPLHKGQVPWRGLLLAASLVTYLNSPATAQVTVEAIPPHVAEGENVLLQVNNLPEKVQVLSWYKGETMDEDNKIVKILIPQKSYKPGIAYIGKIKINLNGSLLLQYVNEKDSGMYTLITIMEDGHKWSSSVQFHVHPHLSKVRVTSLNVSVWEGLLSHKLTCEPKTPNTTYLWRINGQTITEDGKRELSDGNRILTVLNIVRTDTGPYECEARNPVTISRSFPFYLPISYGPDDPIISPSSAHFHSRTNVSLSCEADSIPPAQYSWSVNGELQASSQELFIPDITTKNSGPYTCFAHNSVTGLNRTTVKNITVLEPVTLPVIHVTKTTVKEKEPVMLTCDSNDTEISIRWLFNGQSLGLTDKMKLSQNNSTLSIDSFMKKDSGEYECEVSNPVSSKRSDSIQLDMMPPVLVYWNVSATERVTIEAIPPRVVEGGNVILLVHNLPSTVWVFHWYKGKNLIERNKIATFLKFIGRNETGPAYSGRETLYRSGSMFFRNVTQKDAGSYTLLIVIKNLDVQIPVDFQVDPR